MQSNKKKRITNLKTLFKNFIKNITKYKFYFYEIFLTTN
jgi:hypothetical protein